MNFKSIIVVSVIAILAVLAATMMSKGYKNMLLTGGKVADTPT